ncbi:hypothetical protein CLU79DRAFT_702312 [Phycomyces nitens]|nr:hypothetical protein CLU79DRAFT_702312 [Phycomyces nitens]
MKTIDTKSTQDNQDNKRSTNTDDITEATFVNAANAKVVSLLAKEAGFHSIQRSALDSLSDILGIYLERILYASHTYAELGNLKPAKRLLRVERSKSQNVDQTSHFLPSEDEDEDDFADERRESSGQDLPSYVPSHLPRFPSKHSFRQTPVYIQRPDDPQKVRALNSQQSRTVEENLKRLMSAENQHGLQADDPKDSVASGSTVTMPLVNYENSMQRRARAKQSGFADFRTNGRGSYSGDKPVIPLKRFSDTLDSPSKDARKSVGPVN